MTTSEFSAEAREFATDNGVGLHDVDGLLRLIATRDAKEQEALLRVAFEGDWWRPTCASCGIKLVERTIGSKKGTGGSLGVEFLKQSLFRPAFPDLWAIRHRL